MTKVQEQRIFRTAFLTTGTSTAYAVTATGIDPSVDFEITIEPHTNCAAGPVTLNVNGAGATTIKGPDGNDLAADDLVANVPVKLFFDASQSLFFLLASINRSGSPITTNLGYFFGARSASSQDNPFGTVGARTIELGGFIYLFAGSGINPAGASSRRSVVMVAKIEKATGIITAIGAATVSQGSSGANPALSSSYVDGTDIHINFSGGSTGGFYTLDTTTDSLSSGGGNVTTGVLTDTTTVNYNGDTYEAISEIGVPNGGAGTVGGGLVGYLTVT